MIDKACYFRIYLSRYSPKLSQIIKVKLKPPEISIYSFRKIQSIERKFPEIPPPPGGKVKWNIDSPKYFFEKLQLGIPSEFVLSPKILEMLFYRPWKFSEILSVNKTINFSLIPVAFNCLLLV